MTRMCAKELGINFNGISPAAMQVTQTLQDKGYHQTYLVGGAVRDLLLGHSPKDFDVATSATPEEVRKAFRRAWIIGKRFRLVHVRIKNQVIEVSTFRKTPKASSHKENGLLTEDNTYGNVQEDAYRRDITMNSLMLDPLKKYVYDYTGGLTDLRARRLRIIGTPGVRYREDPVRMLRILRLAAKLNCSIDEKSLAPIKDLASLLSDIVPSRLWEEVIKVVFSPATGKSFQLFQEHAILAHLFPHLSNFQPEQMDFWKTALNNADQISSSGKRVSLTYVVSALFWPAIANRWRDAVAAKKADMNVMHELFSASGIERNNILTRVIRGKVWEIWEHQARFHRHYNKRKALSLKRGYVATKSLDFLRLRNETGDVGDDLANWWGKLIPADNDTRETLVPARTEKRHKRKTRRADESKTEENPGT